MSKNNPFVNCKSRKRRRSNLPFNSQLPKLFCPSTMVRFDDAVLEGYSTIWVCKMCKKSLLSESAVRDHIAKCKAVIYQPVLVHVENDEDFRYVCDVCNKVFSRAVTLKKHKESHESSNSELGVSDEDFDYTSDSPKKKKKKRSSIIPSKLEFIADDADASNTYVENVENV